MKYTTLVSLVCLMIMTAMTPLHAEAPMKALLVTGQNNHNWQLSHPILKTILEDTGLFQVDIAMTAPQAGDMSTFTPTFSDYKVVVLDYNGDDWPETTRQAFLAYVRGGGGVVVYHAADNAFPEWPEFNEIIGLGGWGNRTERHGPYIYWRDGEIVQDMTPGPGGAHGRAHQFVITHRNTEHPITKGLPEAWLHEKDELYHHLRGPAKNMSVLATAWSDPETGGTGNHEPILFTIAYGAGRIFHTVLGHPGYDPPPPMQCAGFIVTLQRGAEWAATGNVTQAVPDDFPTAEKVSLRPAFKKASLEKLLSELAAYTYNASLETMVMLEELARNRIHAGEPLEDLEAGYLALIKSDGATEGAKFFACKQLSLFGGKKTVPALETMLRKEETAYMARYALERIPDNSAINALRKVLPLSSPSVRAGILTSLGIRRDARSVPVISAYIHDGNEQVATAALEALAAIGTQQAAEILLVAAEMKEGTLKGRAMDGYIQCGYALQENGQTKQAKSVFNTAWRRFKDDSLMRAAALRGRIATAGDNTGKVVMEVFQGGKPEMCNIAATAMRDIANPELLTRVAEMLPGLPAQTQVLLITALSENGATDVTTHLMAVAQSEEESVRVAALSALANIGTPPAALFLLERAATTTGSEQEAARFALSRLRGATPVILETLQTGEVPLRNEAVKTVSARHLSEATPILLDMLAKEDGTDKAALLQTLVDVAGTEHLDNILPLLLQAGEGKDSAPLLDVVAGAAKRSDGDGAGWESLAEALKTEQDPQARRNLYAALGKIADAQTLPLFQQGFSESDPAVRLAVMESLGTWPDATPMDLLKQAAEQFKGTAEGSVAIAGYLRLAGLDEKRDANETAALYQAMLSLATSAEDKQACITALGKTGSDAALPVLYEALNSEDEALKTAVLRALGAWPSAAPMTRLETLAKEGPDSLRLEALRGYFRLIGINREISGEEAVARYKEALALAPNAAEKKRILSGLANAQNLGALLVAAECLNDPELKDEAEVAAVKIAAQVAGSHPSQVRPILEQVEAASQSAYVKDEISKIYQQIERFEDYITAWEVTGPYTLEEGGMKKLFNTAFPPEQEEAGIEWQLIPVGTHAEMPFLVELDKVMEGDNRAAYLRTHVWSDAARDAVLELGSDDGNKAWVNGQLVHENNIVRPAAPAQDSVPVSLNEGWNTLLIKVTQGGGEWRLCARLRHPEGSKLEGIHVSIKKD